MKPLPPVFFSIRVKFTLAALAPLALAMIVVSFLGFYLINFWVVGEAQKKVRSDLEAARTVYNHNKSALSDTLYFAAHAAGLTEALELGDLATIEERLQRFMTARGLDVLTLTNAAGAVLVRAGNPGQNLGVVEDADYLQAALAGQVFTGTVVLDERQMARENPYASQRAGIALLTGGDFAMETRGMFLFGARPLRDSQGEILGSLYGGILLNRNLGLVDGIKRTVYGEEVYKDKLLGSATIFLDRVRIATTVRLPNGDRALGTHVSPEVARAIFGEKRTWLDRALVLDDWYLTAYEPILDAQGQAIGSLYVGLLEAPYNALRTRAALALGLILLAGSVLGYLLARRGSKRLSRPILDLERKAQQVARGERNGALHIRASDEVGRLTAAFNHMTQVLCEREDQLRDFNRELEQNVTERTRMLEDKNQQLLRTQEQLAHNEKLAAIGALAAGVAHEINNPTAIIRGNTELLLMELPPQAPGREEAEEVKKQTERISRITENLLAFARHREPQENAIDVCMLLEDTLEQLPHQLAMQGISVQRRYVADLPALYADSGQLRQVFTNLMVNAIEAMGGEGQLMLAADVTADQLVVAVTDSGPGIAPDIRKKLFNPFFTTKKTGSGLGLSVSYGIVERHGGTIEVHSEPGQGATFRVCLPLQGDTGRQAQSRPE